MQEIIDTRPPESVVLGPVPRIATAGRAMAPMSEASTPCQTTSSSRAKSRDICAGPSYISMSLRASNRPSFRALARNLRAQRSGSTFHQRVALPSVANEHDHDRLAYLSGFQQDVLLKCARRRIALGAPRIIVTVKAVIRGRQFLPLSKAHPPS